MIVNQINNKVYIGQTIRSLSVRCAQNCKKSHKGCSAIHNAKSITANNIQYSTMKDAPIATGLSMYKLKSFSIKENYNG